MKEIALSKKSDRKTSARPSGRTSRRPSKRVVARLASEGIVWSAVGGRLAPVGKLLDLSKQGVRYRHDPTCLDGEGFPVPAPESNQSFMLAVTLRPGDPVKAVQVHVIRVSTEKDGSVEVACRFDAGDAKELKILHNKYVDVSLQNARKSLSALQARVLGQPPPERRQRKTIGQLLIKRRAIDRKALEAFALGNRTGIRLGEGLVGAGLVTNRQLAEAMSEHYGIPFVDLSVTAVDPEARALITRSSARSLNVVPFKTGSRRLHVASGTPLSLDEKEALQSESRKKVIPYIADPDQIASLVQGTSVRKRRRATQRIAVDVLARYRFYGSALQAYDARTFEGLVVNLSRTGVLLRGPVPPTLPDEFAQTRSPRLSLALQVFQQEWRAPVLIRLEPVRISVVGDAQAEGKMTGPIGCPTAWIGARVSALVPEDRKNLVDCVQRLT